MKVNTRAYFLKSYNDFRKRYLLMTLFYIAVIAAPIMFLERFTSSEIRYSIISLKDYFSSTFLYEPVKSIVLFLLIYPILEELLYRGPVRLLQLVMARIELSTKIQTFFFAAIITAQSYFWAMQHVSPIGFFTIGIILGILVVKSHSFWMSILAHIAINGVAFLGMFANYWLF